MNIRTEIRRVNAGLQHTPTRPVRLTEGERELIAIVRALPNRNARFMVVQIAKDYLRRKPKRDRNCL